MLIKPQPGQIEKILAERVLHWVKYDRKSKENSASILQKNGNTADGQGRLSPGGNIICA